MGLIDLWMQKPFAKKSAEIAKRWSGVRSSRLNTKIEHKSALLQTGIIAVRSEGLNVWKADLQKPFSKREFLFQTPFVFAFFTCFCILNCDHVFCWPFRPSARSDHQIPMHIRLGECIFIPEREFHLKKEVFFQFFQEIQFTIQADDNGLMNALDDSLACIPRIFWLSKSTWPLLEVVLAWLSYSVRLQAVSSRELLDKDLQDLVLVMTAATDQQAIGKHSFFHIRFAIWVFFRESGDEVRIQLEWFKLNQGLCVPSASKQLHSQHDHLVVDYNVKQTL